MSEFAQWQRRTLIDLWRSRQHWIRRRIGHAGFLTPSSIRSSPKRIVVIAEDSATGAVVGFAVAGLMAPEAELEAIAVSIEYQRQGVARRLFEAMADELRRSQVEEVLLEVRESNQAARALYMSLDFVEEGRRAGYYADPVEDAVLMRSQTR